MNTTIFSIVSIRYENKDSGHTICKSEYIPLTDQRENRFFGKTLPSSCYAIAFLTQEGGEMLSIGLLSAFVCRRPAEKELMKDIVCEVTNQRMPSES